MTGQSRIVLAAASLALLLTYLFPIWKISLDAPQYPEGLGMNIWINTITGEKPHDLKNINGLNHYIGMKTIVPDAIPELRVMPWFMAFMIVFGLVAAASGKRSLMWSWIAIFVVGAVVGLVDFYLWEYDYGHNLDAEKAIIKIPGMNYQPPLIGSKKLLNFTASSWPGLGGWVTIVALGAVMTAAFRELRGRSGASTGERAASSRAAALVTVAALLVAGPISGCNPSPRPIAYGHDQCAFCRMTVLDERFGAEVVNKNGKVFVFDSIECLAGYRNSQRASSKDVHSFWVADFTHPGTLVRLRDATLLRSENVKSPMGMNLAAFGPMLTHEQVVNAFGGGTLEWNEVQDLVADEGGMRPTSLAF